MWTTVTVAHEKHEVDGLVDLDALRGNIRRRDNGGSGRCTAQDRYDYSNIGNDTDAISLLAY